MKKAAFFQPKLLPLLPLAAGGVGFIAWLILMRTQMDAKGLLAANHPLSIFVYILTACTFAAVVLCLLPLKADSRQMRKMFRSSLPAAIGCLLAGVGVLITGIRQVTRQQDILTIVTAVMSFVAAACFVFLGYARQRGSRPHYFVHAGIVVFLMLNLICRYRVWSPEPQLQLYFFQLLACVFLMLTAYQAVCLDIRKGKRWLYLLFSQLSVFCCCLSLTDPEWYFYLGMGIYCATNLCNLQISAPHSRSAEQAPDDTNEV